MTTHADKCIDTQMDRDFDFMRTAALGPAMVKLMTGLSIIKILQRQDSAGAVCNSVMGMLVFCVEGIV